ncbi:hypothetical protein P0Y35_18560 [Kiritimatiellaeota bacterium B1221]|nr:hypothetical protein [Kiritimatiellaeota bacterium B1221]
MKFEEDPDAGRRGEFEEQVKRGWYIGSKTFREQLLDEIEKENLKEDLRGAQKHAHNERRAEALIKAALSEMCLTEEDFLGMKANCLEKQAVAWLVKAHTTVTGKWVCERLKMGHPSNISRSLKKFRISEDEIILNLKTKMTKCKS